MALGATRCVSICRSYNNGATAHRVVCHRKLEEEAYLKTYTGDIAGEGQVEYLMMYRSDGSANFVGLE
jgi:hypothetical protein